AAARAAQQGEAAIGVESGAQRFEVTLARDQFAAPASPIYRELIDLLHELRPAGAALDIVVPRVALDLPGLRPLLDVFAGCRLRAIPDGFAAVALSAATPWPATDGVRLLRRLPAGWIGDHSELVASDVLGRDAAGEQVPTHLLYQGQAHLIGATPLEIGRDPSLHGIVLPEGLAGVSRRHCTLRREAGGVVLVDHSRFGTLVNGERVAGRARLRSGDTLKVGDPGVELNLIAVGG
ncbi:MAG: FHA domain-containing protein, partial [Steroidobacteraceae bacterium]|nr:FHA domain-containing protein [Steroidobacteraceae bacterium]